VAGALRLVCTVAHSRPPASLVVFLISALSRAGASIAVALSVSRSGRRLSCVSASHRGHLVSLMNQQFRPKPILKLPSFLSVGTKQQSRLKYSHSLMSISLQVRLASAVTVVTVYLSLARRSHSLTAIYEQSSPLRQFGVLFLCLLLLFLPPSTRSDVAAAHTQFAYIALERPAPSLRLRAIPMCVCVSHSVPSIMMCCANSAVCALVVQSVLSATSTRTRDDGEVDARSRIGEAASQRIHINAGYAENCTLLP
jgi:hypothetical protein